MDARYFTSPTFEHDLNRDVVHLDDIFDELATEPELRFAIGDRLLDEVRS